ncbi:MAG TPA: hypothetical protein DDZ66_01395 [Firmicutes bacterium]|nr:hypothetical protein [Bacillota bacterium]
MRRTRRQILIGGTMLVVSWLVIFAMVLEFIPQPIELYMIAYAVSLAGFILGTIGASTEIRDNMRKHRNDNDNE